MPTSINLSGPIIATGSDYIIILLNLQCTKFFQKLVQRYTNYRTFLKHTAMIRINKNSEISYKDGTFDKQSVDIIGKKFFGKCSLQITHTITRDLLNGKTQIILDITDGRIVDIPISKDKYKL